MFRTQYDKIDRIYADTGCSMKETYVGQYDDKGNTVLVPTGTIDTYAEIQSHKDSVDINVILKRYVAGDTSVLSRVQGTFMDVSDMPKSYMEVLNMTKRAETEFDSLPAEVREKFDNNFAAYMSELGSDVWMDKLGLARNVDEKFKNSTAAVQEPVQEEVKSE